jgi:S-phase kinase-associated protein 1
MSSSTNQELTNSTELIFSLDDDYERKIGNTITLITNDGINFEILDKYLIHSNMLKIALEDKECKQINLELVNSKQLIYILDYIKQLEDNNCKYSDIPKPVIDTTMKTYLKEWENNFINKVYQEGMLAQIAEVSNYLDVSPLLELTCAKIASLLKGKVNSNEIESIIQSL